SAKPVRGALTPFAPGRYNRNAFSIAPAEASRLVSASGDASFQNSTPLRPKGFGGPGVPFRSRRRRSRGAWEGGLLFAVFRNFLLQSRAAGAGFPGAVSRRDRLGHRCVARHVS